MSELSEILKKYYKKAGNRIIFNNGLSLNLMAMEMWEVMGYKNMDPSQLSRVINGNRLFTNNQITAFSNILSLNNDQSDEIFNSTKNDLFNRYGYSFPKNIFDIVEFCESYLKMFIYSRKCGLINFLNLKNIIY